MLLLYFYMHRLFSRKEKPDVIITSFQLRQTVNVVHMRRGGETNKTLHPET